MDVSTILSRPDVVAAFHEEPMESAEQLKAASLTRSGERWSSRDVEVLARQAGDSLAISVRCPKRPISRVALRWESGFGLRTLLLGDAWERGYGDLQWRFVQPERIMPWYFAAHDPHSGSTFAAGVKTQANAMCFWTVDRRGVTLWLDLRSGGMASIPGDRTIEAASVVAIESHGQESAFAVIRRLCGRMCEKPRLPARPVSGNNNWYYAYGQNFDAKQVLLDAELLADLSSGHANRPYCVIDAGWSSGEGGCPGGPWKEGRWGKFPDMIALAKDIAGRGVRPGIWMRPTALSVVDDPRRLRKGPQASNEKALDCTMPENLQLIREDIARIRGWGYELIKHDFSTWDAFGRWGFDLGAELTDDNWHWADRSLTNAEVILRLYRTLREAAGDAVLIGCNTFGHLGAGLFELQRIGDDTSGRHWERTRKMGVNTLAFRLPQHNTFFSADADCVPHTARTPWEMNRQFLELVAKSGTSLFVSADPRTIPAEVKSAMREAMMLSLSGGAGDCEPLDWLWTTCPEEWRIGGKTVRYNWSESVGAWPMKCY